MSDRCSAGSEEWTTGSTEPDSPTRSSAREEATPTAPVRNGSNGRREHGDEQCSPTTGPECPSTRTYETLAETGAGWWTETLPMLSAHEAKNASALIFSAEASPARTSLSPDNAEDSPVPDPASSSSSPGSLSLFDPDGFSSRTYPDCSPRTAVGTSESLLERWPTSGTAWDGGFSTHVSSECRSDEDGCSSSEPALTMILEPPHSVPDRYSLSARAAQGILRRAERRGKRLPDHLAVALEAVAGHRTPNA